MVGLTDRSRHLQPSPTRLQVAVERLLASFDGLADRVANEPDRYVITHGEPGAQNVLVVNGKHHLIDWESARIAGPERDLRELDPGDGSALAGYEVTTGTSVRRHALDAYRVWYDLFEIGGYIELFRNLHHERADATESWKNLRHFLRPKERWPNLV
jgi:spectinomycin phosphotransferase